MHLFVRLDRSSAAALGHLRAGRDWEAMVAEADLWLRSRDTPQRRVELETLPAAGRFFEDEHHRLVPLGAKLPVQRVPDGEWISLSELLQPGLPPAMLPGEAPLASAKVGLIPGTDHVVTGALHLPWAAFAEWAQTAPAVRLDRLKVAVSAARMALVSGTPPPPVAGTSCYWLGQIAIPCGWMLAPHLWPELLAERLRLNPRDRALLHHDGSVDILREDHWAEVSRGSVLLTSRALDRGSIP